jgi:uncharacterized protein (TIGR02996 family)
VTVDLELALLQAVHDNPLDDTSCLVLADWLEEQGDARAELVRLGQALRGPLDEPKRHTSEERVRALIQSGVRPCVPALANSIGMELVLVRPGSFWMGSPPEETARYPDEGPRHRVSISQPFYLGRYPVTQEQFERVLGHNPAHFQPEGRGAALVEGLDTSRFPVEQVSWQDATAFCAALSALPQERAELRSYRLPTEAEWEYACRGGAASSAAFHFGDSLSSRQANFDGERPYGKARRGPNLRRTTAVGSYPPNAWGLFDMHGNVWEWCNDWFSEDYYGFSLEIDPRGPQTGESRVLRGGSFYYIGSSCRAAIRFGRRPGSRSNLDGFRVAMTVTMTVGAAPPGRGRRW